MSHRTLALSVAVLLVAIGFWLLPHLPVTSASPVATPTPNPTASANPPEVSSIPSDEVVANGVAVLALDHETQLPIAGLESTSGKITDHEGRVILSGGDQLLGGERWQLVAPTDSDAPLLLEFRDRSRRYGRVTSGGVGVEGVRVDVLPNPVIGELEESAVTDVAGEFSVTLRSPNAEAQVVIYDPRFLRSIASTSNDAPIEIPLLEAVTLIVRSPRVESTTCRVKLSWRDGKMRGTRRFTASWEAGEFVFPRVPAASHTIDLSLPGYLAENRELRIGANPHRLTWSPVPAERLEARVKGPEGRPLADAQLELHGPLGAVSFVTSESGEIAVDPAATPEFALVQCSGYGSQLLDLPERPREIDVLLHPEAPLRVRVVLANGTIDRAPRLGICNLDWWPGPASRSRPSSVNASMRLSETYQYSEPDTDGYVTIHGLVPARYRLTWNGPEDQRHTVELVLPPAGEERTLHVSSD